MLRTLILFSVGCAVYAQSDQRLEFEVVSVKLSNPDPRGYTVGCKGGPGSDDPTTFRCTNMSFTNLLARAFGVRYDQIQGPDWLRSQMFEISARVPPNTHEDQFRAMLQNMLTDRFKLQAHRETKDATIFALLVAKGGPKFKEHVDSNNPPNDAPQQLTLDQEGYPEVGYAGMACTGGRCAWGGHNAPLSDLLRQVTAQVGRTVLDETGLRGKYDFKLHWMSAAMAQHEDNGITIMQALQDQLGLKLESRKGREDFLVVDHIEKLPTEN